jgi:hypothetical protein
MGPSIVERWDDDRCEAERCITPRGGVGVGEERWDAERRSGDRRSGTLDASSLSDGRDEGPPLSEGKPEPRPDIVAALIEFVRMGLISGVPGRRPRDRKSVSGGTRLPPEPGGVINLDDGGV